MNKLKNLKKCINDTHFVVGSKLVVPSSSLKLISNLAPLSISEIRSQFNTERFEARSSSAHLNRFRSSEYWR